MRFIAAFKVYGVCLALVLAATLPAMGQLPVEFHRGVNYAHTHRGGRGYGSEVSAQTLRELYKNGVRYVALTPFGYQRTYDAEHIRGIGGGDPSDRLLRDEVKSAHAAGMKVLLKPHIWSNDFWSSRGSNQWHGTIDQKNPAAHARWWQDHRKLILHLAKLAEDTGIEMYCLGTELVKMTTKHATQWRELIGDVRKIYRGKLTYAAHWHEELQKIEFWKDLDYIGVSAYFPLDAPVGADAKTLEAAWVPHVKRLRRLHVRVGKPVMFLEAGYRAVDNCHREPWAYNGGQPDAGAQARAYDAMFSALANKPWFRGIYYWKAFTDPARGHHHGNSPGFAIHGKPAQQVVRSWYAPADERK
jgi:hypothetical protein